MQRLVKLLTALALTAIFASGAHAQGVRMTAPQPNGYSLDRACQRLEPVLVISPRECLEGAVALNYGTGRAAWQDANTVRAAQPITYPGIRPGTTVAALERLGFKSPLIDGTGTAVAAAEHERVAPQTSSPAEETSPGWQFVYNELTKDEGWLDEKFGGLTQGQTDIASSVEGVRTELGANNMLLGEAMANLKPLVTIGRWLNDPRPNLVPQTVYDYMVYTVAIVVGAYILWKLLPMMFALGKYIEEQRILRLQEDDLLKSSTLETGSQEPLWREAGHNVDAQLEEEPYRGTYEEPDGERYQTDRTAA